MAKNIEKKKRSLERQYARANAPGPRAAIMDLYARLERRPYTDKGKRRTRLT